MIATVLGVTPNVKKTSNKPGSKEYEVCEFVYQGDPYDGMQKDPTTRNVFMNDPLVPTILTLTAGDRVDLSFIQKGSYSNLSAVAKVEGEVAPVPTTAGEALAQPMKPKADVWAVKDEKIARAVALKASVELTAGSVTAAQLKKPETLTTNVVALAKMFMNYLTLQDNKEELPMTEVEGTTEDFEEEKF